MQIDQRGESGIQLLRLVNPVHPRPAAAKVIPLEPPQLFAMRFRDLFQIRFPIARQSQPPAVHARMTIGAVAAEGER